MALEQIPVFAFWNSPFIIPVFVVGIVMAIPIIAILTSHQRKMAEIHAQQGAMQREHDNQLAAQMNQLQSEVRELRELMHQQILALDDSGSLRKNLETAQSKTELPPIHRQENVENG